MTPITWYLYGRSGGAKKAVEEIGIKGSVSGSVAAFSDGANDVAVKSLVATINPVQSGSGDPSPTNVRPISGRTGLTVVRCGKNLLPKYVISPSVYNNVTFTVYDDGSVSAVGTASATCNAGNVINGIGGEYILSGCPSGGGASTYQLWVFDQTTGAAVGTADTGNGATVTLDKTHTYSVRLRVQSGYTINKTFFPMLRPATITDDTYEPYTAQTYPVSWQTEAGTIYGGTLDVVSGVLTVDRKLVLINTRVWAGDTTVGRYYITATPTDALNVGTASTTTEGLAIASNVHNVGVKSIASMDDGSLSQYNRSFRIYDSSCTTAAEYIEKYGEGQLCYYLATPQTYQLTPTEVKTLLGGNTIYTDAGAVSVEYVADTKLYIDNKVAELQALILEN